VNQIRGAVRWATFVALTVIMVGVYCYAAGRALPPLRNEPAGFLLLPMTVISGLVSLLLYPVLRRQRERSSRALALYVGFIVATVVYGGYLWVFIPDGSIGLVALAIIAGHLYGFPLLLAVMAASLLMNRVLFGGEAGQSQ
jgi:hypothetical protein